MTELLSDHCRARVSTCLSMTRMLSYENRNGERFWKSRCTIGKRSRADVLMRCKSTDITIGDIKFIARLTTNRNLHRIPTWYRWEKEREREREREEGEKRKEGREKDRFIVLEQVPLKHITEIKAKCKRYTRRCMINKYERDWEE